MFFKLSFKNSCQPSKHTDVNTSTYCNICTSSSIKPPVSVHHPSLGLAFTCGRYIMKWRGVISLSHVRGILDQHTERKAFCLNQLLSQGFRLSLNISWKWGLCVCVCVFGLRMRMWDVWNTVGEIEETSLPSHQQSKIFYPSRCSILSSRGFLIYLMKGDMNVSSIWPLFYWAPVNVICNRYLAFIISMETLNSA